MSDDDFQNSSGDNQNLNQNDFSPQKSSPPQSPQQSPHSPHFSHTNLSPTQSPTQSPKNKNVRFQEVPKVQPRQPRPASQPRRTSWSEWAYLHKEGIYNSFCAAGLLLVVGGTYFVYTQLKKSE